MTDKLYFNFFKCINVLFFKVPNVEYPADHTQLSSQSASSVVRAGLVASTAASLASMWRGWTK
jgi:hypothetical protein